MTSSIQDLQVDQDQEEQTQKMRRKPMTGFPHTEESKAKISAANKGKTPWNAGKKHSEETKRRIAEKTREVSFSTDLKITLKERHRYVSIHSYL